MTGSIAFASLFLVNVCVAPEEGHKEVEKKSSPGRPIEFDKGELGSSDGDVWGREGRSGLQAGIRLVNFGTAMEYVLRNTRNSVFEMRSANPWTFYLEDNQGHLRTFRPAKQPGGPAL